MLRRRTVLGLTGLPLLRALPALAAPAQALLTETSVSSLLQDRDHLYFTAGKRLCKLPKRGGRPVVLVEDAFAIYAVERGRAVYSVLVGEKVSYHTVATSGGAPSALVAGTTLSKDHVADASGVYFDDLTDSGLFLIRHVPLEGGPAREVAESPGEVGMLVTDATDVYWSVMGGVLAVPKNGGVPRGIGGGESADTYALAVDERFVYWTNHDEGALRRAPKRGGKATLLVRKGSPDQIALDDRFVYFADSDLEREVTSIRRVPKTGGAPETLVTRRSTTIEALIVDAKAIYWLEQKRSQRERSEATIMRLPR